MLIIDDEAAIARQLAEGLNALGHSASYVSVVTDARARIARDPSIGVLIADLRMPGVDGLQLAQEIVQGRDDCHAIEAIIITGHASPEDAAAALGAGVAHFIRKPFRLAEAHAAVSRARDAALARRRKAAPDGAARTLPGAIVAT